MVAGLVVRLHPGPSALDRRGFAIIAKSNSTLLHRISDLGSPGVLVLGTLLAAMVVVRVDRWRAAACVAGPVVTAVLVELVFKPLVARRYLGVLSYPSGTVADVAAVMTAWAVAVPGWIRPAVVGLGAVVVVSMMVAVVGLRWHYPTDALAGAVLGVGTVLTVDGAVHLR
jgi:membrane-associated phospholipid phosphatase